MAKEKPRYVRMNGTQIQDHHWYQVRIDDSLSIELARVKLDDDGRPKFFTPEYSDGYHIKPDEDQPREGEIRLSAVKAWVPGDTAKDHIKNLQQAVEWFKLQAQGYETVVPADAGTS